MQASTIKTDLPLDTEDQARSLIPSRPFYNNEIIQIKNEDKSWVFIVRFVILIPTTVEELWKQLGDIPVNEDGEIEANYLRFSVGTDREDIWDWFEDFFGISVTSLMFKNGKPDSRASDRNLLAIKAMKTPIRSEYFSAPIQKWIHNLFVTSGKVPHTQLIKEMTDKGIDSTLAHQLVYSERGNFPDGTGAYTIDFSNYEPEDDRIFSASDMAELALEIGQEFTAAIISGSKTVDDLCLEDYIQLKLAEHGGDDSSESWISPIDYPSEENFLL